MSRAVRWIAILLLVVGGLGFWQITKLAPTQAEVADGVARQLPPFSFPDLDGVLHHSDEWRGKVLVVNFWATWCPPCRREIPHFIEAQQRHGDKGLQFVGISIERPDVIWKYAQKQRINYPLLVGDDATATRLALTLGNRTDALPFTAIFDRDGNTAYVRAGLLTAQQLESELKQLL